MLQYRLYQYYTISIQLSKKRGRMSKNSIILRGYPGQSCHNPKIVQTFQLPGDLDVHNVVQVFNAFARIADAMCCLKGWDVPSHQSVLWLSC